MADLKIQMLKRFPAFEGCDKRELELFGRSCDVVRLLPGERLITQGAFNRAWWGLLEGDVAVSVDGEVPFALGPGTFLGEISMESHSRATATVTALTEGQALVMSDAQYRAVRGNQRVHHRMLTAASARLAGDRIRHARQ